jgi:asparagine synthase (glutamine-hydrolysing)
MCGFTGFYNKKTSLSRSELYVACKAMNDAIEHRGPDSFGIWQDPDLPLVLGHRRLAIIDLSDDGHQPMASNSDRYTIAYNGEIYNFQELRTDLEAQGIQFRGRCDTEILIEAIDFWGLNLTLQKINGMYAFVVWDRKERELHFVRDRMGKKPVYVGWAGDALVFGSELKALRAHKDFKPEINREALALYMQHSSVPAPYCIYKNVWSLPAGFTLTIALDHYKSGEDLGAHMQPYWHHLEVIKDAREKMIDGDDKSVVDDFEALLEQCVSDRMMSDVPLGAFLSGGIDSSTIVALMQKHSSRPVKTYAIGFNEQGFNEAEHAKAVATHLGTDHHELYLSHHDALDSMAFLQDIYDEPFADMSAIPTYLVSQFARGDVTVALSGDGGDEMLGGYNRHIKAPRIWNITNGNSSFIFKLLAKIGQKIPTHIWDKINQSHPQFGTRVHKAAKMMDARSEDDIYARLTQCWDDQIVHGAHMSEGLLKSSEWNCMDMDLTLAEKMMYWDALGYLPNDILVKVDRATMAHGLEARAPLLDKRIYDFAWRLPERFKIRNGQGKWLLRQVLYRHVPEDLINRPKQGFTMPVGEWLRGDLKEWANKMLNKDRLSADDLLDADMIQNTWQEHLNGQGNHAQKLWTVLMFQSWKERWM